MVTVVDSVPERGDEYAMPLRGDLDAGEQVLGPEVARDVLQQLWNFSKLLLVHTR